MELRGPRRRESPRETRMEPLIERLQLDPSVAMSPSATRRPRRASDLRGCFRDASALEGLIRAGDPVIYETLEAPVPEAAGHLSFGITVLYPGKVGTEYFMTKGHFHTRRQTAEVYAGLRGRGYLVMQTEQGEARALPIEPGGVVYVAPGWAHRTVNVGDAPLVVLYTFPADAGHDYGAIAATGFALCVVEVEGTPAVVERGRQPRATGVGGEES